MNMPNFLVEILILIKKNIARQISAPIKANSHAAKNMS